MVIRRRTVSLLQPRTNGRGDGNGFDHVPTAVNLEHIRRSNWDGCQGTFRLAAIILSLTGTACIAWAYATAPNAGGDRTVDHYVTDKQDIPWILIPLSLSTLYNILSLVLSFLRVFIFHPYATLPFDLFNLLTLAGVNLISTFGAIQTLQWTAAQYYDDATSGHDGYYIFNPDRDKPGQPRLLKVPPQNATVCSGWDGDCAAQDVFTRKTHARARVELVGVGCAWVVVVLYFVVFIYACVATHRFRKAKRRVRVERLGFEIAKNIVGKQESSQEY